MKDQKMFMVFNDGHIEEVLQFMEGKIGPKDPIAITKNGIYMKSSVIGSWAKIEGPVSVTVEAFPYDYKRPNFQGTAEFSFCPAYVTAVLKADNVTKVE